MINYVKPDAKIIPSKKLNTNPHRELNAEIKAQILSIDGDINKFSVRKVCHVSTVNATELLEAMRAAGKLQTVAEVQSEK